MFKLAYVGTISNWFDWETIKYVLNKIKDVEVHLFGPIDNINMPIENGIIYHGTIEHDKIYETIKDMDCLIMPFVVNDIIKAVDPVKLYEYINFNKNIIVSKYKEIERYKEFIYAYSTQDEFVSIVKDIKNNNVTKYTNEQRINFLKKNSWENRVKQIKEVIDTNV